MSKLSKKRVLIVAFIIVTIFMLTGCASKNAVIGNWKDAAGQNMQFFDDGTLTSGGLLNATGKYSFPDSSHLKLELQGLLSLAGPQLYEYKVIGNKLVLKDSNGLESELTKVK